MGVTELHVLSKTPYNAEPPLTELVKHPITPRHLVYKRNHCTFLPCDVLISLLTLTYLTLLHPLIRTGPYTSSSTFGRRQTRIAFTADTIDLKSTADTYTVRIDGNFDGLEQKAITYPDILNRFPRKEVVAALVVRHLLHNTLR